MMDGIGRAGPARALSHGERRELAATLRAGNSGYAVARFLAAYGPTVYDFIMLMLGPGDLADRVVADTTVAVTGVARWLRDDDLLTAWVFALARYQCRRYPPVVWRERQWEGRLRSLAMGGPVGQRASVPVDIVRMALLGIAPKDREVLVLSSTYCKLLSNDLAAVFGISGEDAAAAVAGAHRRFEQALALCAEEVGYRRDPHNRAPEIGELVGMVFRGIDRPLPADHIFHVTQSPELAAYRWEVTSGIQLNEYDGFPLPWNPGRARKHLGAPRHPTEGRPRRMPRPAMAEGRYGAERAAGGHPARRPSFAPKPRAGWERAPADRVPPVSRRQMPHLSIG
jgi:DNA-directed RNA polymerase specialized sigma24 family protein